MTTGGAVPLPRPALGLTAPAEFSQAIEPDRVEGSSPLSGSEWFQLHEHCTEIAVTVAVLLLTGLGLLLLGFAAPGLVYCALACLAVAVLLESFHRHPDLRSRVAQRHVPALQVRTTSVLAGQDDVESGAQGLRAA